MHVQARPTIQSTVQPRLTSSSSSKSKGFTAHNMEEGELVKSAHREHTTAYATTRVKHRQSDSVVAARNCQDSSTANNSGFVGQEHQLHRQLLNRLPRSAPQPAGCTRHNTNKTAAPQKSLHDTDNKQVF
jgi:hypothetical protein